MHRPVVFLDLDFTLYDTDSLIQLINEKLAAMGHDLADVKRHVNELNDIGFSFPRLLERLGHTPAMAAVASPEFERLLALGNCLLMDGVVPALERVAKVADLVLVTYGYPPYQIEKYRHLTDLHPLITECHFVWRGITKGDVIRSYGRQRPLVFWDDSPSHLADVKSKSPLTVCVRAMWPAFKPAAHVEDGQRWRTVDTVEKFADLVCNVFDDS